MTLTPDRAMLADPATTFPVYLDPVYKTVKASAWLMVSSGGWKDDDFTGDGYSGCPAGDVVLDATAGMKEAAAGGWSTLTLGLRAATEDDQLGWKRFADDAYLRVHYNTPPPQPPMKNLWSSPGGACAGPSAPVRVNSVPVVHATLKDPDGDKVYGLFQASWNGGTGWTSARIGPYAGGSGFQASLPSTIPEGVTIGWSVRAYDGTSYSPWSYAGNATACYFVYDHTAPAPPVITSPAYDAGGYPKSNANDETDPWYAGVGRYGAFTFTSAATDVVKYTYGIIGDPAGMHDVATTAGAPRTVQVMPTSVGVNVLEVSAVDGAGNKSTDTYPFRVSAGGGAKATYALDEPIDAAQVKDTSGGNAAGVHGGVTLGVDGVTGTAMQLNGADGYASTSGPLLDTTKSFSVSAWARLTATKPDHAGIIATQAGAQKSGFELYYSSALDRWAFNRFASDTATAPLVRAASAAAPQGGEWTHLLGVYDAVAQTLTLYVNGRLAQTISYLTPWNATGALQLGTGSYGGVPGSFFSGDIDDVHVFDRVVTGQEARDLFSQRPVVAARWKLNDAAATVRTPKAYWKLDEAAGATRAEDTQGAYPAGAHGGATFGTTGKVGKAMHLPGSTGYAATSGPVVDTTKSFSVSAWARLTVKTVTPVVASQEGSVGSAFQLYYSSNYDRWIFNMQTPDSTTPIYIRAQSVAPPTLNAWTHLTGVYDAGARTIRLYVNGVLQQTVNQPNVWSGTGPLNLGRFKSKGAYTSYFTGDLDDVRVFDQPLTDSEAALLAGTSISAATTADDSLFGRHATLFGNAYVGQGTAWVGNGALVLDGDGDYAASTGPVVDTGQSFTIAGWVQTAGRPTRAAAIFSQEGNVNSGFTLRYAPGQNNADGYQIDMPAADTTGASHQTANDSSFQVTGDWDHVAIVYDAFADQIRLYVNGALEQTDTNVSYRDNTIGFNATKAFQIGRSKTDGTYGEYWPGVIDDVWAFNGVATDDQIAKLASGQELSTPTF